MSKSRDKTCATHQTTQQACPKSLRSCTESHIRACEKAPRQRSDGKLNNEYSPHERSLLRRAIHVLSIITHRQAFTISLLPVTSKKEPKKQSCAGFGRTRPRCRGPVGTLPPAPPLGGVPYVPRGAPLGLTENLNTFQRVL